MTWTLTQWRVYKQSHPLDAHAWPGGYPIVYYDLETADTLCASCAWEAVCDDIPIDRDIHYEGPDHHCAGCETVIPSAYGDPEDRWP